MFVVMNGPLNEHNLIISCITVIFMHITIMTDSENVGCTTILIIISLFVLMRSTCNIQEGKIQIKTMSFCTNHI